MLIPETELPSKPVGRRAFLALGGLTVVGVVTGGANWLSSHSQRAFNERLQHTLRRSVWQAGCRSWYLSASGKNTALWPGFSFVFKHRTRRVRVRDYTFA